MSYASVRRRPAPHNDVQLNGDDERGDRYQPKSFSHGSGAAYRRQLPPTSSVINESVWLLIFSLFAAILLYVHALFSALPPAVSVDSATPGQFVEERARQTLNDLTAFGARPVGSRANEQLTVDYLLNEIAKVRSVMNAEEHSLDVDVQRVSGTFALDFLGQFTSCYDNINNIIVKLCPKHGSNDSLLVNCHYDSVINSTGIYA